MVDKTVDDQVSDVEEVSEDNKETIGLLGVEDSGDDEEPKGKNVTGKVSYCRYCVGCSWA